MANMTFKTNLVPDNSGTQKTLGSSSAKWDGYFTNINGVSVGSSPKFTDTVYMHPTTSGNKHIPSGGSAGQFLKWSEDGTAIWAADNNTTYSAATTSVAGLMSAADKTKLDDIAASANNYTLPKATSSALGGIKTNYTTSGKYYAVAVDEDGNAYVNVPWTDSNTTYSFTNKAATLAWGTTSTIATVGGVDITLTMPANPDTNTNYYHTTGSWSGFTYTATANGGAGTLAFTIPTGTSASTVALGNHTHNYLPLSGGELSGDLRLRMGDTDRSIIFDYDGDATAGASWRIAGLGSGSSDTNYFAIDSGTSTVSATTWNRVLQIGQNTYDITISGNFVPSANNSKTLGTSSLKWNNIYATTFTGNLSGTATKVSNALTFGNKTYDGSTAKTITAADLNIINALQFIGTTTTNIASSPSTTTITLTSGSTKTVTSSDSGKVVIYNNCSYWWNGSAWEKIGTGDGSTYKITQEEYNSDAAATNKWISYISQDTNGNITATTSSLDTSGTWSGTANKAVAFSSNVSVALTGDVTGSASSTKGWSIATTLASSGVTAGSYGPSANASPAHGATFSVPYITVDAKGRVTSASTKTITLPSDNNTDTKNTAGSTDTSSKIYLVGATSQASSATTYSDNQVYVTNGQLDANIVRIGEAASLVYDSTNKCLNFTFA